MRAHLVTIGLFFCVFFTAHAAFSNTAASFSIAPVSVLSSTDYSGNFAGTNILAPSGSNETLAVVGIVGDSSSPKVYSATVRMINATTFLPIGTDTSLTLAVKCITAPVVAQYSAGTVSMACAEQRNSFNQVFLHVWATSTTSASTKQEVQITSNADSDIEYTIVASWYQGGYYFVAYTSHTTTASTSNDIYVQGISVSSVTTSGALFTTPLKINNAVTSMPDLILKCGQHGSYNKTYCIWRRGESNTVVGVTIDLNNKNVSSETTLFTDDTSTYYTPLSVVTGSDYYAALVATSAPATSDEFTGIKAQLSFLTTVSTLNYTLPSDMTQFTLGGVIPYQAGWALLLNQYSATASSVGVNAFQRDATINGTQLALATDGTGAQLFVQANGSAYVMITNTNTNGGTPTEAYIGQLYHSIILPTFGKHLLPSLAFIVIALVAFFMI